MPRLKYNNFSLRPNKSRMMDLFFVKNPFSAKTAATKTWVFGESFLDYGQRHLVLSTYIYVLEGIFYFLPSTIVLKWTQTLHLSLPLENMCQKCLNKQKENARILRAFNTSTPPWGLTSFFLLWPKDLGRLRKIQVWSLVCRLQVSKQAVIKVAPDKIVLCSASGPARARTAWGKILNFDQSQSFQTVFIRPYLYTLHFTLYTGLFTGILGELLNLEGKALWKVHLLQKVHLECVKKRVRFQKEIESESSNNMPFGLSRSYIWFRYKLWKWLQCHLPQMATKMLCLRPSVWTFARCWLASQSPSRSPWLPELASPSLWTPEGRRLWLQRRRRNQRHQPWSGMPGEEKNFWKRNSMLQLRSRLRKNQLLQKKLKFLPKLPVDFVTIPLHLHLQRGARWC